MSNTAGEDLFNNEDPANYIVRDGKVIAAPQWYWKRLNLEEKFLQDVAGDDEVKS